MESRYEDDYSYDIKRGFMRARQVIVSGDFFQLPPVPDVEGVRAKSSDLSFAFEAECWDTLFPEAYKLVKIFRQKDPSKCISIEMYSKLTT